MDLTFIDKIRFGNPSKEDHYNMKVENYLDRIIPKLRNMSAPANSSRATKEELNLLMDYAGQVEANGRKSVFDSSLVPYIEDLFARNGADPDYVHELTQGVVDDVLPVITKLKYYFNRPRPYQLAYYYQLKLFPDFSMFVSSPSYPSGHATLGTVLCHVLGNHYPESYETMLGFLQEVAESRLYLGVHYPSDVNMAELTARAILDNVEFKVKYKL